jgi:hypothetical protein
MAIGLRVEEQTTPQKSTRSRKVTLTVYYKVEGARKKILRAILNINGQIIAEDNEAAGRLIKLIGEIGQTIGEITEYPPERHIPHHSYKERLSINNTISPRIIRERIKT